VDFRLEVVVAESRRSTTTTEIKYERSRNVEEALKMRAHEMPSYRWHESIELAIRKQRLKNTFEECKSVLIVEAVDHSFELCRAFEIRDCR